MREDVVSRPQVPWGVPVGIVLGAAMLVLIAAVANGSVTAGGRAGRWTPVAGSPFDQPPVFHSSDGELHATLTAAERTIEVAGSPVKARVYNGLFTGPTLEVRPGDTMFITLVNHLEEPTNLHVHGLHVSPVKPADDVFLEVAAGKTFTFRIHLPASEPPGLYWYHSHIHHMTEEQVFGGMSGMIVVDGLTKLLPQDLRSVTQRLFALRDIRVANGEVVKTGAVVKGTTRLVNSLFKPKLTIAPGETQLWRFANVGADIFYKVGLPTPNGPVTFHVVAEDGRPVWRVWNATSLVLPPGKRYEVLVRGPAAGAYELKAQPYSQGVMNQRGSVALASVTSKGPRQTPKALPTGLVPPEDLRDETVAKSLTEVFQDGFTGGFTINGKTFSPDRIDVRAKLGTVQRWTLVNGSPEQHPFHIHTDYFQVISRNGEPFEANGLQDTVIIPTHGSVVILIEFDDFVGKTVFHCHILAHEDHGMMATIQISKPS
ncbi:MAG TPA: multicopper oxidase domain-containing protein [Actinomycetota bacterium]